MTDIVTVTLNPAVDVATSVEHLVDTHKLRCARPRRDPGGGGINVARTIHRLGGDCVALYLAGGPTGDVLTLLLEAEHLPGMRIRIGRIESWQDMNDLRGLARMDGRQWTL